MTDNLTTELLPCPFCGGKAEIHPSNDWDVKFTGSTYFAWCDKCETRGDYYNTEAEAIEAWNTRAMNGTLTAEQVREAAKSNSRQYESPVDDGVWITEYDWQAIADELNAKLGNELCDAVRDKRTQTIVCSKCGGGGLTIPNKGQKALRNFCPNCGARIRKKVER